MLARSLPATLRADFRRVLRDRFLVGASAYILACAVATRWIAPWLQSELMASSGFDVGPYLPLGVSYFVVVNASVFTGLVGGFLLLETREENTVQALLVTQTPLVVPVGALGLVVFLAGAATTTVLASVVGVGVPPFVSVIASALVGAPTGVVMMLGLATAASNKVEAFAVMKLTALLGMVPVGAYFLPEPWQLVAGVAPPYWGCKIWWAAASGEPWGWAFAPGVLVSATWIVLLVRRLRVAAAS